MVVFPHCKINLGLNILRKREDSYHELETVFYPLPLKDVLEIAPAPSTSAIAPSTPAIAPSTSPAAPSASATAPSASAAAPSTSTIAPALPTTPTQFRFRNSGLPIPGDPETNLCAKAYLLLKKDFPNLPPVDAWLYKQIPLGAGLGGGSADGAFMLKLLDSTFELHLGRERLAAYALQLGSDCPYFLYDVPCFATGRGELLEPMTVDLSAWHIVLVYPGIHIPTVRAFAELRPSIPPTPLKTILSQPVDTWRSALVNDFEEPACQQYPALRQIKEQLYRSGAVYASMTGSGSAFYGLFPRDSPLPDPGQFPGYFFRIL